MLFLSSSIHPFIEELARHLIKHHVKTILISTKIINIRTLKSTSSIKWSVMLLIKVAAYNPRLLFRLLTSTLKYFPSSPKRLLTMIYYWGIAGFIYRLYARHRFDIVHAFWTYPAGIASVIAGSAVRRPVVVSILGYDVVGERTLRYGFFREVSRLAVEHADAAIISEEYYYAALRRVLGVERARVRVIPVGVDTSRFSPEVSGRHVREKLGISDSEVVVSFAPHLRDPYGPEDFLRVALIVSRHAPHTVFVFMGEGPLSEKLKKLSHAHNLKAIFTGNIPHREMPYYYAATDVFCSTSYAGQGVSVLEAMASGKPVVGYRIGVVRIRDGIDGFLVEGGNVEEFAEKVLLLVRDLELRRAMGANARVKVLSQYSIAASVRAVLRLYYSLLRRSLQLSADEGILF